MIQALKTICDSLVNYHEFKENPEIHVYPNSVRFGTGRGYVFLPVFRMKKASFLRRRTSGAFFTEVFCRRARFLSKNHRLTKKTLRF